MNSILMQGYALYADGTYNMSIDSKLSEHIDTNGNGEADIGETWGKADFDYLGTIEIGNDTFPVYGKTYSYGLSESFVAVPKGADIPEWPATLPTVKTESYPYCFAAGTSVELVHAVASAGSRTDVSELHIGDSIKTHSCECAKILWVGKQEIDTRFDAAERLQPVRIKANGLGNNIPDTDLTVSNDHAFLVDGILATAGSLVNNTSIYRVPLSEFPDGKITYYHIETEKHELILANNTPAETFIDNVSRSSFDNYQEYVDLYGEEREMDEMDLPRAMSPRQLPKSIKARLAQRAIELGYAEEAVA